MYMFNLKPKLLLSPQPNHMGGCEAQCPQCPVLVLYNQQLSFYVTHARRWHHLKYCKVLEELGGLWDQDLFPKMMSLALATTDSVRFAG